jgi:hypothetical protein
VGETGFGRVSGEGMWGGEGRGGEGRGGEGRGWAGPEAAWERAKGAPQLGKDLRLLCSLRKGEGTPWLWKPRRGFLASEGGWVGEWEATRGGPGSGCVCHGSRLSAKGLEGRYGVAVGW